MNAALCLALLALTSATPPSRNDTCRVRHLSKPTAPSGLSFNASQATYEIYHKVVNHKAFDFASVSGDIFRRDGEVAGVILTSARTRGGLALNLTGRLQVFANRTDETEPFWASFNRSKGSGWMPLFKDCFYFPEQWFYGYVLRTSDISIGLFMRVRLNPCDGDLAEIFEGNHRCDEETTACVPLDVSGKFGGGYRCVCRPGYFYPLVAENFSNAGFSGLSANDGIDTLRCVQEPPQKCGPSGLCGVSIDFYLKSIIFAIHLGCMLLTIILGIFVFRHRKSKAISTGMWTILEIILLGACILYSAIFVNFSERSLWRCLVEPWAREMGFIICYGAVILKLYRHLIEFRTRKAHRWVVKDTDLLKYLLIMALSVFAYMAAYTASAMDFVVRERFDLFVDGRTRRGLRYRACKPLWADFVTQLGELAILVFGIHLSYATRNARTQFHERSFLCAAISIELAVSAIYYVARIVVMPGLHPNHVLVIGSARTIFSTTCTLLLVFVPKFWYQQKQVRSLGQEYSCRFPWDACKAQDANAHGPLTGNNSDVDVGEITLADMSPDDIRAELKRLYLQLEILKSKTICRDNPHISKRRGGRKPAHRRFSLQNLHAKKGGNRNEESVTEPEPSRTPEDSVCSTEGPSTIYCDLVSTPC